MLIVVIILIAIMCAGMTVKGKNEFFEDYCSHKNTNTVNAIFSILIFPIFNFFCSIKFITVLEYKLIESFLMLK